MVIIASVFGNFLNILHLSFVFCICASFDNDIVYGDFVEIKRFLQQGKDPGPPLVAKSPSKCQFNAKSDNSLAQTMLFMQSKQHPKPPLPKIHQNFQNPISPDKNQILHFSYKSSES